MKNRSARWLLALVALLAAAPLTAQVPWESPYLVTPHAPAGVGLHYVDFGQRPHDGQGLLLTHRGHAGPGLALRLAATYPRNDDVRVSGGADYSLPLLSRTETFPLDVVWTSGLGASYGEYLAVGVPVGVAAGRPLLAGRVAPYMSARLVLEGYFGGGRPDDGFGTALALDAGVDVSLVSSRMAILRAAASLGDRRALLLGLHVAPRRRTAAPL